MYRVHIISAVRLAAILVFALVCACSWPLENPLDQDRCDPSCLTGNTCYNGVCIPLDSGPKVPDAHPDRFVPIADSVRWPDAASLDIAIMPDMCIVKGCFVDSFEKTVFTGSSEWISGLTITLNSVSDKAGTGHALISAYDSCGTKLGGPYDCSSAAPTDISVAGRKIKVKVMNYNASIATPWATLNMYATCSP